MKNTSLEIQEIGSLLQNANSWYRGRVDSLYEWKNELTYELQKTIEFKDHSLAWNKEITKWMIESGFFSENFLEKQSNILAKNSGHGFGALFFWYTNKIVLSRIIGISDERDRQRLESNIERETENRFRYISITVNGLFSDFHRLPDKTSSYWFEAGSEWSYSVVVIKENDKWVIDKIERYSK